MRLCCRFPEGEEEKKNSQVMIIGNNNVFEVGARILVAQSCQGEGSRGWGGEGGGGREALSLCHHLAKFCRLFCSLLSIVGQTSALSQKQGTDAPNRLFMTGVGLSVSQSLFLCFCLSFCVCVCLCLCLSLCLSPSLSLSPLSLLWKE